MQRLLKILAVCSLLGANLAPSLAQSDTHAAERTPTEAQFVSLLNSERVQRGLRPLVWDETLCTAGRQHSQEMASLKYFDHISPVSSLKTPADRWEHVASRTPDRYTIGENLFYGSEPDVAWAHQSLMASPHHRENILNGDYDKVGIGVYVSGDGQMWVTEMFLADSARNASGQGASDTATK